MRRAALPLAAILAAACASPSTTGPSPAPAPARSYAAHPGFDSYYYPGDSALRAWRPPASPYRWVGYYLPAPCHRESSWSGRRPTIEALGWGIAVLYVGQQTWEGQAQVAAPGVPPSAAVTTAPSPADTMARPTTRAPGDTLRTPGDTLPRAATAAAAAPPACAVSELTAARGAADGADAVATAASEGFAAGTVIYLDVERMERIPQAMHDYHRAWVRAVAADGRFRPGIYCHTRNAVELHAAVRAELAAAGVAEPPRFWVASSTGFDVTKRPEEVGHPFATAWQGAFDVRETWGGVTLRIDANVARTPSPSSP